MSGFVQAIDGEIAALERELEALPVYVKLRELKRVRSLYIDSATVFTREDSDVPKARKKSAPFSAGKSLDAVNAVIGFLEQHGRPVKTAALIEWLDLHGITFSGSAPQNTLSSLLSRSTDVESRGGHIGWALTKWNSAGGEASANNTPPADDQPEAQGREAGPGGGT